MSLVLRPNGQIPDAGPLGGLPADSRFLLGQFMGRSLQAASVFDDGRAECRGHKRLESGAGRSIPPGPEIEVEAVAGDFRPVCRLRAAQVLDCRSGRYDDLDRGFVPQLFHRCDDPFVHQLLVPVVTDEIPVL